MFWYSLFLFLHIVFAAFWVGGMLFLPLVMLPAVKDNQDRHNILIKSGLRFRLFGWISLAGLFLTGLSNMHYKGMSWSYDFFFQTSIGKVLFWKLVIFAVMIIFLVIHDIFIGKLLQQTSGENDLQLNKIAKYTGRINLILSLLIVFLALMISRNFTF